MPVFFNGRSYVTPAVMSVVDDSKMYNRGLSVGNNIALIGAAEGGDPDEVMVFGSAVDAKNKLLNGDLLRGVELAFNASQQSPGPAKVYAVRVGSKKTASPPSKSTRIFVDSEGVDTILLTSMNYGASQNKITVGFTPVNYTETIGGVVYDLKSYTVATSLRLPNSKGVLTTYGARITQSAGKVFTIQYSGTGDGLITINNQSVILTLNSVVTELDLNIYKTVKLLKDRLTTITGIVVAGVGSVDTKEALNGLDGVTSQDIKTGKFMVTRTLQQLVDWFNGSTESLVVAERLPNATLLPVKHTTLAMTGGADGTATMDDWSYAFETLETSDVQWIVPLSGAPEIHAMASAHVSYMSDVSRQERRAICGTTSGTSDELALEYAKDINSDRVSLTHLGVYNYNDVGALVLFEPYFAAVMITSAFAGLNPGTPMTNKSLKISGVERKLRNPADTDALISGGVLCIADTPIGYKVVQSVSTWLLNENYNRIEVSVGLAMDFVVRNVRNVLEDIKGRKNDPLTLGMAMSRVDTVLRELSKPEPTGPGVLAGDADNPPYAGLQAIQEGDILRIEFQCSPVIPVNYIPVTVYAKPYSGGSNALIG